MEQQILRDRLGNRVGEYTSRDNTTRDRLSRRMGTGNPLATLNQNA